MLQNLLEIVENGKDANEWIASHSDLIECNTFFEVKGVFLDEDLEEFFREHHVSYTEIDETTWELTDGELTVKLNVKEIENRFGDDLPDETILDFNSIQTNSVVQTTVSGEELKMEQENEVLYSFVMKRDGDVVGGQSQFLLEHEVGKYVNNYKRAYQANEVMVYVYDSNLFVLQKNHSIIEEEECLNCKGTGNFLGIPGEPCPSCSLNTINK